MKYLDELRDIIRKKITSSRSAIIFCVCELIISLDSGSLTTE